MVRSLVKTAAAEALDRTGVRRLAASRPPDALVLGYHQVVDDLGAGSSIPAMQVSRRTLERQLDCVARERRFVPLDELAEQMESGRPADRPLAAVTFDDGYRDVYEHALPLLRRKGIPAAVFVVTDLIGTEGLQRHDRLYLALVRRLRRAEGRAELARILAAPGLQRPVPALEAARPDAFAVLRALLEALSATEIERVLDAMGPDAASAGADHPELRPLTREMVVEMHRTGVTIGSHTCTHVLLSGESRGRARTELRASRERLESWLLAPVRHFAYPDGSFDAAVVEEVAAAGYRYAYTCCAHRDGRHPLLTVPRRVLWENSSAGAAGRFSGAVMRCLTGGVFDRAARCRRPHARSTWAAA